MSRRGHGEGSIYFESHRNRWIGKITLPPDGTGKQRRAKVTGRTKTDVREKLKAIQRRASDGLPVGDGTMTLNRYLDMWLVDVLPARSRVQSVNTISSYRWALEILRPAIGKRTLRTLTPDDVERALRSLAERGMSQNSIMRARSVLRMALKHAQRRDMVARNAAELAEMPARGRPRQDGRSLTEKQARQLLAAADGRRLGALIVIGVMLGLRPGELCGLRWTDVDLDGGVLHVRQALKREHHDGHEVLLLGEPKTKKSRRTLSMPAPVIDALKRHRALQAQERLASRCWEDNDLVFPTRLGTPMNPSNLRRDFDAITMAAGLGGWTPKELRHSAGSLLSAAGVPLEQIADLLGHVDTRMLERVYRHPVTPSVTAAVAPMERLFGSTESS